jgi:trigger factor
LKVTTEHTEDRVANLTIEVSDDEVRPALDKAARQVSGRFSIPGFRKGRAPFDVVQRMVGEDYLLREALEDMAPELVERAIKEQDLEPFSRPELKDVQIKPMRLVVVVPLEPEVQLGDYKTIHIDRPTAEVTDEDVAEAIESLRRERAVREPIDRPVNAGDWVAGRFEVGTEGDSHSDEDASFRVPTVEEEGIPGLSEHLVGAKVGDNVEFDTTMPEEYPDKDMAGKPAHVSMSIIKTEQEVLPEVNDEFAVLMGDYENLDALKKETRERLEREAKQRADGELRSKAVDALVAGATMKYPHAAVEDETDRLVETIKQQLQQQRISLEAYLKAMGMTEQQFHERQHPAAERNLREGLAMREFIEAEGLKVTDEEMRARTERAGNNLAGESQAQTLLRSPEFQRRMASNLLFDRAMRRLISIVTGEPEEAEPEIPAEEMPAAPVDVIEVSEAEDAPSALGGPSGQEEG